MKRKTVKFLFNFVAIAIFMSIAVSSQADVIYNNFSNGTQQYENNWAWTIGSNGTFFDWAGGPAFTVSGSNYNLDSIKLAVGTMYANNNLTVKLANDNNGLPGSIIETFNIYGLGESCSNNAPIIIDSSLHPLLTANTQYWLLGFAAAGDVFGWQPNNTGDIGPRTVSDFGGPFYVLNDGAATQAFAVYGTPTPIPAAIWIFGSGIAGLAGLRRRKKKTV